MDETQLIDKEEKLLIQRAYRELLKCIHSPLNDEDRENIRNAYELAVEAHAKQRRKSGEPYILHPIAVARICAEEIGLGPTAVVAALLHDVVEDTDVSLEDIYSKFGDRVAMIVDGLTKLDRSYDSDSPQAENFRKVLSTLVKDVRVVLIKMADRLHNMRTLGSMPRHKQLAIAAETNYIYAPLAHRLGLYNMKTEFQDLCMKITDQDSYQEIARKLQETKASRTAYIDKFIVPLTHELKEAGLNFRITGRPKSIHSIWNKIKSKEVSFEEIYDLFAVRIILDVPRRQEKQACWQVYSIVTDVYRPIPERLKDWVTTPKSNGYESLHTTVIGPDGRFVEVQIRTERMDEISERGYAAHWKYKGVSDAPDVYESWLDNVREILDNHETDAIEFLNDFKTNLFNEEVYVYTPAGDMKILPKGATALDFAFMIHTDLGLRCTAIKINNRLVPMGYRLQNGDQVGVQTSKNQKPNESWLKLVVTGKARSKIRTALREERKQQGAIGKETLERKLQQLKVELEPNADMLVKHFGFRSRLDLYNAITHEEVNLHELKKFKVDGQKLIPPSMDVVQETEKVVEPVHPTTFRKTTPPKLLINGEPADQYDYSLANCCNPVMGDDVFAFLSSSSGMKIHRTTCPNATNLMANYGYRVMKAEWVQAGSASFKVDLLVTGIDAGPGVIERLSQRISSTLGLNIRSFYIDGDEGFFEGKISLIVNNKDQIIQAIQALKTLDGVSSVTRVEST
ncbi:MAG: bifunctional (p)ppGpp synthetase/guanosine-3',5'-bis(diphosphate) 3'-pyrophosphohydrolase [Lewinellaceae bacterium]|nr:bifunctional (p)ppGpp synthetase/guanosine-3',5'-bis(diphosphate) 3'-pyrophosphohydrolase [Saprospiraceae bacterium]MCB9314141.1 bifunctional (p)ppGpp synthetase/guanosine-3',5'-bis(diphosphate) 3'-pyrophosphohydrolase [Lewinellaceae bacterium]HRW75186.1 RelA/SpoT family protein [Saprospiraceae bacterium]